MNQKTLYGIVALLAALLAISSTVGLYYYAEYSQQASINSNLQSELSASSQKYAQTSSQYNSLVSQYAKIQGAYNGSLDSFQQVSSLYNESVVTFNLLSVEFQNLSNGYNATLSLLTNAVEVLNTSEPAYSAASTQLASLWQSYTSLEAGYSQAVMTYAAVFSGFQSDIASFDSKNNVSASQALLKPVEPVSVSLLEASMLIDFGNSTYHWYNDTAIQPGWNAYVYTLVLTSGRVDATWYPSLGEHFVNGIDGAEGTQTTAWFLWQYNATSSAWQVAQEGADYTPVFNGTLFAWTLCSYDSSFNPTCTPH